MALISIKRNIDLQPGLNAPAVFNCSQSDKGTTIMLGLMNGGNDYTVPSGVTITIRGSRSNGAVFTPTSATFSGSTVSFTLTEEMTDTAGPTLCEAVLEQGNNVLGTANFIINVEASPMGADVPPVFTDAAWTWMLGKLTTETVPALGDDVISSIQGKVDKSQGSTNAKKFLRVNTSGNVSLASTDKTLSVADQIADAKETGDQIRALDAEIDGVATTLGGSISTLNGITTGLQSSKLNKNQGTSNSGKTMVVDSSGNIVPGDVPITIDDTLSIADAAADAKAAGDAIALKANASTIAPEFSDQNTYTAGSYVYKNGVLYRFTASHTGEWIGTDAEIVTVSNEINSLKTALDYEKDGVERIFTEWEQGAINYSTGEETQSTTTCRSIGYFVPTRNKTVRIVNPNSQTIGLRKYGSSGDYIGSVDMSSLSEITLTAGNKYRVVDASTGVPANISALFLCNTDNAQEIEDKLEEKIDIQGLNFAGTNLFSVADKSDDFTTGKYIKCNGTGYTIDPESLKTDADMCCIVFDVSPGDAVYIKGWSKTGSERRFYNVINANNLVLVTGETGTSEREVTLTIPQNGSKIVINLRSNYAKSVLHQSCPANNRITNLENQSAETTTNIDSYTSTPGLFRFSGTFKQGEFGGFSDITNAMKLVSAVTFDKPTRLSVPEGFSIVIRDSSSGTRTAYDNYAVIPANTSVGIAIKYTDPTIVMTENVARQNLYYTKPISLEPYITSFSSPAIFDNIGIIGDSYAVGSMHWENNGYKGYPQYSWGKLMCKRNGNNCSLYAHGGYGISRWITNILPTVLQDDPKDFYWWGLGINDNETARTNAEARGSLDDLSGGDWTQYPDTLYGMYAKAYEQVVAHAPLAKHVFVSCIKDTANHRWTSYKAINTLLTEIADHYNVPFIDLVDDPFYTSSYYWNQIMTGHPTLIGYGGMSYANERLLNRCIANNVSYFKDYGRTNNPDDTDPTGTE